MANDQERAVLKLTELLSLEFHLDPVQIFQLKIHLDCLYSLGYVEGSKQSSHRKPVEQLKDGKFVKYFKSVTDAARANGVNKSTIQKAIKNNSISKRGFTFRYKLL